MTMGSHKQLWRFEAIGESIEMFVELTLDGMLLITVLSNREEAKGMISAKVSTKKQLNMFLVFLCGTSEQMNNRLYEFDYPVTYFPQIKIMKNHHPDFNLSQGETSGSGVRQDSDAYKKMLLIINVFSKSNIIEVIMSKGFLQFLS